MRYNGGTPRGLIVPDRGEVCLESNQSIHHPRGGPTSWTRTWLSRGEWSTVGSLLSWICCLIPACARPVTHQPSSKPRTTWGGRWANVTRAGHPPPVSARQSVPFTGRSSREQLW